EHVQRDGQRRGSRPAKADPKDAARERETGSTQQHPPTKPGWRHATDEQRVWRRYSGVDVPVKFVSMVTTWDAPRAQTRPGSTHGSVISIRGLSRPGRVAAPSVASCGPS